MSGDTMKLNFGLPPWRDRFEAVVVRNEAKYPLSPEGRRLLNILQYHGGAAKAIQARELSASLHVTERDIKALVKDLVERFGMPIGASRQDPFGYYMIETPEELTAATRAYHSEVRSLVRRIHALEGEQSVVELFGQLQLELKESA